MFALFEYSLTCFSTAFDDATDDIVGNVSDGTILPTFPVFTLPVSLAFDNCLKAFILWFRRFSFVFVIELTDGAFVDADAWAKAEKDWRSVATLRNLELFRSFNE